MIIFKARVTSISLSFHNFTSISEKTLLIFSHSGYSRGSAPTVIYSTGFYIDGRIHSLYNVYNTSFSFDVN